MAKPGLNWAEKIGFGLLLVVVVLIFNRSGGGGPEPVPPGTPLPELMAEGWLNADTVPNRENLQGKVVVVDFWATWCGPCRVSLPKLAKLYERYEPLGVEFVGLTEEPAGDQAAIEGLMKSVDGFTWPVGYGAGPTLEMLGVQYLPTLVVFKDGVATWSSTSTQGLEAALDEALAR